MGYAVCCRPCSLKFDLKYNSTLKMKSFKLKLTAVILMFLGIAGSLYAQGNRKITGNIKDAKTHDVISFATVALTDQNTKASIKGAQTDVNGNFSLDNLPAGTFTLRLSFVGYDPIVKENITLNQENDTFNVGNVEMNASPNKVLNEVTVTSKKPTIQNKDGKKIFAVNQSLVSQGGTAADL